MKEYKEAVKYRKPCLTYVKKVNKRETKLLEFVDNNLKNEFHYFEFRANKDLIAQVDIDLRRFIFETLRIGLEGRAKKKARARSIEEKALSAISKTLPSTPLPKDPLMAAEFALRKGNYLECLVMTTVTIENGLQNMLLARGISINARSSLGELIQLTKRAQLLSAEDLGSLRRISIYRNIAVHQGDTPSKEKTRWILETAQKILARFEEKRNLQGSEAETVTTTRQEKELTSVDQNVLQAADGDQITKLDIDDDLLDHFYEQARLEATKAYDDACLSYFGILAHPYGKPHPTVSIFMYFFSKWGDRICSFQYDVLTQTLIRNLPDKRSKLNLFKGEFADLPWKTSPQWRQFLSRAYDKIKPLSPARETYYSLWLHPTPEAKWNLVFEDGLNGNEYSFEWNGRKLDQDSIKQLP
jgi:HEPN domain-containing protein